MKRFPYRYCRWCEEKIAPDLWFPYCSEYCTKTAIEAGWTRLGGKP